MALTRGGKRPGGGPPSQPLTAAEQRLVDAVARMLRETAQAVDLDALVTAINILDPSTFEDILQEVTVVYLQARLIDALQKAYRERAVAEFRRVMEQDARPGAPILQDDMVRLPNGLVVPRSLAMLAPDVMTEFQINAALPGAQIVTDFIDPAAIRYAETRGAMLVRDVDAANRTALRYILRDSMAKGLSAYDTARAMRQSVGLHTRWARAVDNYDAATMRQLLKAGMTPAAARARADELVKRYRDRLIRRRAEMIARTEIQMAQNMARQTSWDTAYKTGLLDGGSKKEWLVAPSGSRRGAPCDTCASLNGKRVQWNAAFPTGHIMPPAHPHCRCTAVLIPPSRGLSGLPSQDMDSWLRQLQAMEMS